MFVVAHWAWFDGRCRRELGAGVDEYAVDDPAVWFAVMWSLLLDGRAQGAFRAVGELRDSFEWGGRGKPWKATFGRTPEAAAAAQAHMDAAGPALVREPKPLQS